MKRTLILFLLIMSSAFAFFVFGFEKVKIEDYEWKMRTIAHVEENQVVYDAVEEKDDIHQGAAVIDMTLIAKDGKITILDVTNGIFYEGTYLITSKNPKGTDYRIMIDEKSGCATAAMTTYLSGTKEPTLPINLDGYSMYFYGEK